MRILLPAVLFLLPLRAVTIATAHVDNSRTGANTSETRLTPSNVVAGKFGQLGTYAIDGYHYPMTLYIPGLTVSGATHTCLIAVTSANTVYCFNADIPNSLALWSTNLGTPFPASSTPSTYLLNGMTTVGIMSTPVADVATNRLYVVRDTTGPVWSLYKLNLSTGAIIDHTDIAATGFSAQQQLQRAALAYFNGNVYVCFGSYNDTAPWYGFIFQYDAASMTKLHSFRASVSGGAGLWGASGGPAIDSSGNLYMATGNGTYNGTTDWGESALKWDADLNLLVSYTPANWPTLNGNDSDLSSGRVMLDPDSNSASFGAKDYNVYNLDRTTMGSAQVFITNPAGVISTHSGIYGGTLINHRGYFPNVAGKIYAYTLTSGTYNTTAVATTAASYQHPGAILSSSSNGASSTIIWGVTDDLNAEGDLRAGTFRAWDADLNPLFVDASLGSQAKYSAPVVADGKVFVATQDNLILVYGLLNGSRISGEVVVSGQVVIQ